MRETAYEVLKMLGMQDHQAVIVQHTDTAHPHVHILRQHGPPRNRGSDSLSNDGYKLDRWCDTTSCAWA